MAKIEDGGQAFPHGDPTHGGDVGMTLRDYFASSTLPGIFRAVCAGQHNGKPADESFPEYIARTAYDIADAMIARRSQLP